MNIFEALRISHVTQRALADRLIQTQGDTLERRAIVSSLQRELAAHAAAEERYFYLPLSACCQLLQLSPHGIAEHHQMDQLMNALALADPRSPAWQLGALALHDKVHQHLEVEERSWFPLAGTALDTADQVSLALQYESEFVLQRVKA